MRLGFANCTTFSVENYRLETICTVRKGTVYHAAFVVRLDWLAIDEDGTHWNLFTVAL
jgi:hypothetical protein